VVGVLPADGVVRLDDGLAGVVVLDEVAELVVER
jgi:hypothetical protein